MRRRRKVALGLLAGAAMAGAVGWILLARGAGMGALVPAALRRAAPQGWRIEVASVEGDWRSRLRLRDLVMTGPSGTVSVRELLIHYRLSPLLGRRIEIPRIDVIEPRAHLRADTTAAPEEPSDSARSPALDLLTGASPLGAWSLELGELRVSRAAATLEGTRGAYEVEDAGLLASARLDSGTVMLAVDSLVALLEPPDGDAGTGELRFAGMLRNGVARVRELELRSSRSRVHGEGQVALARPATAADSAAAARVEALGFTLRAAPLDLRDLPLELPGPVLADPLVTLSVDASGGSDSAQVHAVSEGPASVRADLTAVLRLAAPGASGGASPAADVAAEPELTLHGQAAADLAAWAPPPLNGALTLEVDAEVERLDGSGAARARGTLLHRPGAEAPEGVLGRPLRVRVEAERASSADDADRSLDALVLLGSLRAGSWEELGAVRASAAGTRADWSADLALDTGSLSGRGSVAWGEGAARVVVDALALRDLDVAALDASLPPSDLTGRLVASVAGAALDDLAGEVALAAAPSTFGETRLDTLALTATLRPGTVEGALLAALPGAHLTSSVDVRLTDSLVEASLPDLHLVVPVADSAVAARAAAGAASADSAAPDAATTDRAAADSLAADTAAAEARARVVATWALGAARRRGTLLAELDSASVAGLGVRSGRVDATLAGDSVRARARLALAALLSAPATLEADADLVGPSLAEAVGAVRVTATRAPPPAGDSARAGAPPPDSLAPGSLAKDSLALDVVARRPGRFELVAGLLPAEGGAVRAEGTATVTDEGTSFDVRLAGALPEPTSLLRGAAVDTLSLAVSGARAEAGWRRLAASFALAGAHWRELTAQGLVAEVRADSAGLALDTLGLESDVLTLGGRGSLPAEAGADGRIDVTATFDLEPLREATGVDVPTIGTNALTASATGSLDSLEIVAGLHTTALAQGEVRIAGADLDVQALLAPSDSGELAGLRRTRTELRLDRILLPHAEVSSVEASLEGGPDSLRLAATALVDEGRRGELEATVDPRPDSRHVRFDRFELQLDEDRWLLAGGPAVLSYGNGVSLSSFAVTAGRQTIAVEGGVDAEGALDLTLDVDSTGVGTVADLLGLPRLDGWIGGTARLGGTTRAPLGTLDFDAGFGLQDESPVTLRLLAEADGARATAELTMQDPEGGSARVEGIVPLPGGGAQAASTGAGGAEAAPPAPGQLDLRVSAEAFQLAHLLALLDPNQVAVLGGLLDASLTVAGPPDAPTLDGPLTLSSGAASFPALGVPWEPIRLYARGAGSDLVIDSGFVAAGPGAMRVAGRIALADSMALDVGVALESFEAIRTRAFQSVVSGDLHAGGTLAAPVVEGEISVESLDVWLDELAAASGVENVQLTEDDIQTLRERFGYIVVEEELEPPTAERLTAELAVELGRDSWIRRRANPGMAVAFSGELDVHVLPGAQPEVEGTLTTIAGRGFVEQFGKRFVLREGTVTLDGAPSSAALDLAAEYRVPSRSNPDDAEATIVLGIAGTQDSLSLELSSEPPMENADIVSYIATGRPASSHLAVADASGGGGGGVGGDLAEVGAGIAAGQIASAVELAAQRSIGLDVVEIRREGVRGATLVAGKYLSPRLYLGFAQPVLQREGAGAQLGRQSSSEIEVEYQLVRDWLLNLEGSGSALRAFLRGRFAY